METNSFGEDLVVKTRKPYTITKQREKWTEEEHNRFLEALKLYGRAWQRIEEHIGTKTAIQIRSHAQKFFTKLEKEAAATGTHLGQARDIAIPPPRPKKKPSYPYPRKTGFCSTPPPADDKTLKTMKNPPPHEINKQKASVAAKSLQQSQECSDEAHSSVVLNLFQDAPSASIPHKNKASKNQSSFREYVPSSKRSSLTIEVNTEPTLNREQGLQYHEGHEATVDNGDSPSNASPLMNHTIPAAMSYISHPFPTFPTQDFYSSFLAISPAFPTQIASTLLQNPAVHAAACMAASSLYPSEEINSSTAIVAATVAAASAWWATNGLIPLFPPLHPSAFPFSPQEKMEACKNSSTDVLSSSSSSKKIENNFCHFDGAKKSQKNDRSSCGSNAASSSEIETDAVLEKNGKTKDQNLPVGEFNTRRVRSSLCFNETWREVSHEGRLAFQALFARDILPQSFVSQLDKPEMGLLKEDEIKHGNVKVWRTGFKPYKRCSAEVEVHKSSANDETCNKKIRLQGEV